MSGRASTATSSSITPIRTTCWHSSGQGRQQNDQPHAFKLLGSYQAPLGITVGANYQALSGLVRDRNVERPVRTGDVQHPRRGAGRVPRGQL